MPKGYFIPFTEEEEQKIKDEYLEKPVKRLAKELGTTFGRIKRFLDRNGLVIPQELADKRKEKGMIKTGQTPFNKGKKQSEFMSKEGIERSKNTRFKKGRKPHNTKVNGKTTKRSDGYTYIRVSEGRWELYHRFLWEKEHGKIPEEMLLVFKDNNPNNINLDNLELISTTENMYRNSKMNYPEEIIPSLVLTKKIEHKLNDLQNG